MGFFKRLRIHPRHGPIHVPGLLLCLALSLAASPLFAQSSSTSYVLQQSTVNAGGEPCTSTSYAFVGSAAQESVIGTSSSTVYVLQSGFWGFAGSGLVPVILTVARNAGDPTHIDLSWSGNNSPYDIYQASDCANVFGSFYGSTAANSYPNITPPAVGLVCYSVLATAPGPAPPPTDPR